MKKHNAIFILFFLPFLINSTINAQNIWELQGNVLDSTSAPMVAATVMLMQLTNDKLEDFAITDNNGHFQFKSKKEGAFKLQITYVGYGTFVREIDLTKEKKVIDFGDIILRPDAYLLDGVTVKESFLPILIKKDTIEYHADAFKTAPNASVEDLLKKLPGIEVDKDGTIKAQGEEVKQIFIDGKEFFDNDPKIASRNIPADVVHKVQVFDKKSEFTEFTGIDDGQDSKAINLKIKDGKNKGTFGNVKGAYGTDNRYQGSTSLNRFDSKMQISVLGNINNTNEQAFSLMDYLDFSGGLEDLMSGEGLDLSQLPSNLVDNSGQTDTYSGGLNFNYDFNKKTTLRSNYFFDRSDNQTKVGSRFLRILDDGNFSNETTANQFQSLANHRLKFKLSHEFDATQDLKTEFKLGYSDTQKRENSNSKSFAENEVLRNKTDINQQSTFQNLNWSSRIAYRKKLKKKGRFLTSEVKFEGKENDGQNELNTSSALSYTPSISDSILQKQNSQFSNLSYRANVNYVEPLGTTKYLSFSFSSANNEANNEKIFLDRTTDNTYITNNFLSNHFKRNYITNEAGIAFKRIWTNLNFSIGGDFQYINVRNKTLQNNTQIRKSFKKILPNARLDYQINPSSQLQINYSTRVKLPSIKQIQAVVDNVDPLNIYIGNPDLSAEYIHGLNLEFFKPKSILFPKYVSWVLMSSTSKIALQKQKLLTTN